MTIAKVEAALDGEGVGDAIQVMLKPEEEADRIRTVNDTAASGAE